MTVVLPARLQSGVLTINFPTEYNAIDGHPALGAPYRWEAAIDIIPQALGIPLDTFTYGYDASFVKVGDWVASSDEGKLLQIQAISGVSGSVVSLTLEDVGSYNAMLDTNYGLDGSIPSGPCVVFTTDSYGLPVLGPYPSGAFQDIAQSNIEARFNQMGIYTFPGSGAGDNGVLGVPTDGNLQDGAIRSWVPGVTTVTDAADQLNYLLAKALPARPTDVKDLVVTFNNQSPVLEGTLLANGALPIQVPNAQFAYLTPVVAISSTNTTTDLLQGVGDGNFGTLSVAINDVPKGSITLTSASDVGVNGNLQITNDVDFPPGTTGIWSALDFVVSAPTLGDGVNKINISHTVTGSKDVILCVEDLFSAPVISNYTHAISTSNIVYSSGVPHLTLNSAMTFTMTSTNLVGRTFPAANNMGISTSPSIGQIQLDYTASGFPSIMEIHNGPITVTNVPVAFTQDGIASKVTIFYEARNSFLNSVQTDDDTILYTSGTGNFFNESDADLKRIALPNGNTPVVGTIDFATNWNSGNSSSLGDLADWEAPVIGGTIQADQTNYSVNHVPVGPDFSAKQGVQYVTFKIQKITNRLLLTIAGEYSGVWIKLPGITNDMPNAVNGWWDGTKQADFAPTLYPGHPLASNGCLLNKDGSNVEFTFGNISSAAATDQMILIRFKLTGIDILGSIQVL